MNKLSIVLPSYNEEKMIRKTAKVILHTENKVYYGKHKHNNEN